MHDGDAFGPPPLLGLVRLFLAIRSSRCSLRALVQRPSGPAREMTIIYCVTTLISVSLIVFPLKLCSVARFKPPKLWNFSQVACKPLPVAGM
jgi:hypothetical protein